MKKPELSIVIPIWNAEASVGRIIGRILQQQNFIKFELILVNDGSTDGTGQILQDFAASDQRVKLITQKNAGQSAARNVGIEKATGQYLMFFDADDDIEPEMLEVMVKNISKSDSDLVACGWRTDLLHKGKVIRDYNVFSPKPFTMSGNPNIRRQVVKSVLENGLFYNLWNKIYRLDIVKKYRLKLTRDLRFGEDLTFNLEFLKRAEKVAAISEALYRYSYGSDSSEVRKSSLDYQNRLRNFQSLENFADSSDPEQQKLLQKIKRRWFLSFARAITESNLPNQQKITRLKQAGQHENLPLSKSPKTLLNFIKFVVAIRNLKILLK
ncbi:MAG: glycosyltransferase [Candidatus Nomurabacteria bacterium]|jgi:glycosyltransferase involved in cell wall biosynthesis|nr:glycosyltransferase [Candidatus Nomurabacteria bacterium]